MNAKAIISWFLIDWRYCTSFAVLLPKRMLIQTAGIRRETRYGHHCWSAKSLAKFVLKMFKKSQVFLEGFQSWMSRGLSFLLPFLFFGYVSFKAILVSFWHLWFEYYFFSVLGVVQFNRALQHISAGGVSRVAGACVELHIFHTLSGQLLHDIHSHKKKAQANNATLAWHKIQILRLEKAGHTKREKRLTTYWHTHTLFLEKKKF